ncbi:Protein of unknown function (DUF4237) [Streptoalloteichus tenebrarius]|uniref:TNT domain-containing protein n=1 Tax=Streptoalloteichus tenebrarius (strain ATCC 17920 / DSM 40477 / JCM 4838 / CBS 697.72 / NBRC 16177 / NCIMB 11028 / NRRL B-12390 / A12253. 1 / ISP 5477) TaxID=1933 RepID=A0ABT1I1A1_STRSD|nr:Protein of unknown function (DUF4237) [Streptoalloteichus tenebrarius]
MSDEPERMSPEAEELTRRLMGAVGAEAPTDWAELRLVSRRVGRLAGDTAHVVRQRGGTTQFHPSPACADLVDQLRSVMHNPRRGTWFTARITLVRGGEPTAAFDRDREPDWESPVGPDVYREDLRVFPRAPEHVPEWLVRKVGLLRTTQEEPAPAPFRRALTFDGVDATGRPAVDRPVVPPGDLGPLLNYLSGAPVIGASGVTEVDQLAPHAPQVVPATFHTDGTWIWPGAVVYYLRQHGVPPQPELVEHARARGFTVPEVEEATLHAATVAVGGRVTAPASPSTVDDDTVVLEVRRRLAGFGVPPHAYRIGETADNAWYLMRNAHDWFVGRSRPGELPRQLRFTELNDAAAFLLGSVLLELAPAAAEPAPVAGARHVVAQQIEPLPGEPPLELYRDLRRMVLSVGTEVDRFGSADGNVLYAAGTPFAWRSLPPDWADLPHHAYRVQRPVEVLAGTAIPWFGQPGGGIGYVFPLPLRDLVTDGVLLPLRDYPRP